MKTTFKWAISASIIAVVLLLLNVPAAAQGEVVQEIVIWENSGSNLYDYQVEIVLNTSNFDFSLAQPDGSDIRFTGDTGEQISFWIEEWISDKSARIWVKAPFIPADETAPIFMQYGDGVILSGSDGDATFEFFDDFKHSTLDSSKWSTNAVNTITYSVNDFFRFEDATKSEQNYWIYDGGDQGSQIHANWNPTGDFSVEWKATISDQSSTEMGEGGIAILTSDYYPIYYLSIGDWCGGPDFIHIAIAIITDNTSAPIQYYEDIIGSQCSSGGPPTVLERSFAIHRMGNIYSAKVDGALINTYVSDDEVSRIGLTAGAYGEYPYLDYIQLENLKIRKYAQQEPSVTIGVPIIPKSPLLASYPFNGNALDESGNGFDGTVMGAVLTQDRNGVPDSAYLFNNPTTSNVNRILLTGPDGFNGGQKLDNLSVSLWFLPYEQTDDCSYIFRLASTDGIGHLHYYQDGNVSFSLRTIDEGIINQMIAAPAPQNTWHHAVGTWDGAAMNFYVDGAWSGDALFPWTLSVPPTPTGNSLGANFNPNSSDPDHVCSFNGKIDDVRVYSYPLNESEIEELYLEGIEVPVANFTASPISGPAPLEVQFNDTSTGNPSSWNWTFGDGNTSTAQNPIHTYTMVGNYSVSLTVSNGSENDTVPKEQYIKVEPLLPNAELIFNINHNRGTANDSIASGMSLGRLVYFTGVYNPADSQSISGNLSFVLDAPSIIALIPDIYGELNGTLATWQFPPSTAIDPGATLSTTARTSVLTPQTSGVTLERICNRTTFAEAGDQLVTLHMTFDTVDLDGLWGRLECSETADVHPAFIPGTISTDLPLVITMEGSERVQFTINHSQVETGRQYTLSYAVAVDPFRPVAYAPSCAIWEVTDAASATAPSGTSVSLPASLLPESVTNVEFSSETLCQWSCSRNYHIVTSISQRAEQIPAQPAGEVTINASGGTVHSIGDEIVLSGYNSASATTYLFLTGPDLPTNGASLNNFMPAVTNVTETFTTVDVDGNNNWNYSWEVWGLDLEPGDYTVYAASEPKNFEDMGGIPNASITIELNNPTLNATISTQTLLQGEKLNISGTATGDPNSIAFWILGTNYASLGTETVSPLSDSFDFQIDTHWMSEGGYTAILQHPGKNALFDTYLNWSDGYIVEDGSGNYFVIHGSGSLQSNEAIAALLHMLNQSGDDLHTVLTFEIIDPNIPIGDVPGSSVTITVPGGCTGYLGDNITLSGTNTLNGTVYLSILGPNLPISGGKLEDPQTAAISGVPSSFTVVPVDGQSWQYRWDTASLDLDGILPYGTNYTVVAAAEPKTADELYTTEFASVTVTLLTPSITEMHPAFLAKGDNITIEGVATGSPFNVLIWVIGPDFRLSLIEDVDPDGSIQFNLTDTAVLLSGEYYVIAQHPMLNGLFDVYPVWDAPGSQVRDRFGNYFSFEGIDGPSAIETRDALLEMLQSPYIDETYAHSMFSLDDPWIDIDPISNATAGESIIISGTTNIAAEDTIGIEIISQKTNSTVFSGFAEISTGNFTSTWIFGLNTTSLHPDVYSVIIRSDNPYSAANSSFIVFDSVNLEEPMMNLHFDEGTGVVAHDSSGNGNDGTIYGASWVNGISGKALDFNGSTDYLDLGNLGLSTSTGTIETWIYPRTIGCCKQIFSARSDDNQNNVQFFLTGTTDLGFHITQNGSAVIEIYNPLTANRWHHVVVTQDGMTSRMFIDGELQEDFDSGEWFDDVYGLNEYAIGRMRWMSNYYFDGIIDEFSIYTRALSPEEVQTHYLSIADNLTQAPIANFVAYPLYGAAPLNVSFIDLSSGNPTNWSWDVDGDGIADYSTQNVTHTYTAPGTYSVSLTASNGAGSNTTIKTGYINVQGEVTIAVAGPGSYYLGETLSISGTNSQSETTYLFITGDGLDPEGVSLSDISLNVSEGYFTEVPVNPDQTWSFQWDTSVAGDLATESYGNYSWGSYPPISIYAVADSVGASGITGHAHATQELLFYRPFVAAQVQYSIIDRGDAQIISGFAEGDPDHVYVWMFGPMSRLLGIPVPVESDGTFEFILDSVTTQALSGGQYFAFIQHPGVNHVPEIHPDYETNPNTSFINDTGYSVDLSNTGPLEGARFVTDSVRNAASAGISDDSYTKLIFHIYAEYGESISTSLVTGWNSAYPDWYIINATAGDPLVVNVTTSWSDGPLVMVNSPDIEPTQYTSATNTIELTFSVNQSGTFEFGIDDNGRDDGGPYTIEFSNVVNTLPAADFSAWPLYGNAPLSVIFTDLSTGNPTLWNWSFGDGAYSDEENPVHIYNVSGTHTVSLTVSNDAGTNTTTKTGCIAVLEPCLNTILAPGDTVFIGETGLDLTASMGGFSTAAWYEPGSLPGVDVPSNIYSVSPGATNSILSSVFKGYTGPWYQGTTTNEIAFLVEEPAIDIRVIDSSTSAIVNNASITEGENKLNFQIDSNLFPMWLQRTSCDGDGGVYIFVRTPEGAVLNALINDNGTVQEYSEIRPITAQFIPPISDSNATVHWDTLGYAPGMYMIWASTNVNGMEASSPTHSLVILSESPLAQFTASLTSGPAPLAVTFNDTSTGDIDEWNWDFGDGNTSSTQNTIHEYPTPGIYTVSLTVAGPGGSDTIYSEINVTEPQTPNNPPVPNAGGPYTAPEGSPITFDASASSDPDEDSIQFRWDFESDDAWDTPWTETPTADYTWLDDYEGMVTLEVSDGIVNVSDTATITVTNLPPVVSAGENKTAETGTTVLFNGTATDPGTEDVLSIVWSFGDNTSATDTLSPSHTYASPGTYSVTLTVSDDDGGMDTDTATVTVTELVLPPSAQFTASPTVGPAPLTVTFNDTSTGNPTTWNWSFGDETYSTEKDPAHVYTEPGTYSVTLKVSNPLGNSTKSEPELITVEPEEVGGEIAYYLIHSNIDGALVYFNNGNETYFAGEIENGCLNATVYLALEPVVSYTVEKNGYLSYTGFIETSPDKGETFDLPSKLYSAYSQLDFEVPGVTIVMVMNGEPRQYIEIDPSQFTPDSILIEGDDVIITDPELQFPEIVYHLSGMVVDQNISGYLEGADFTSPALSAMLEDGETVEPSFAMSFDLLPESGSIGIGILEGERTEEAQSFFGFADTQGTPLDSLKYVVEVDSASLGGELGGVNVYFRADLDWVEAYGTENVKIFRCDNTGSITVLATEVIETTETAVIFQGYSPDGLSVFAIAAERPPTYDNSGDGGDSGDSRSSKDESSQETELPQDVPPVEEPPVIEPELLSELPVQQIPEQILPQTEPLITDSPLSPADALISEISRISSITPGDYFTGLASSVETATKTNYVQSPVAQALPKEACPVAAVATGIGVAGLGAALTGTAAFSLQGTAGTAADAMMGARVPSGTSQMARVQQAARPYVQRLASRTWRSPGISQRIDRAWEFIRKFLGFETIGYLGLKEVQWRKILPRSHEPTFFGLSYRELAFAGISIGLLATAFTFAGRMNVSMTTVFLFILMGAIAVIGHELITNIIARQNQCDSEFRMWGLGALILFANAGLFGLAFGKPSRTLVAGTQHLSDRDRGTLMLIGPLVNVIFALISLYLIPLGGLLGAAGAIGFPINIMLGLYVLIPVQPMKGKIIFQWNRLVWAIFFVPLVILYISVYYLF